MTNFNHHGADLDGKSKIKLTDFDAFNQQVRGEHVPTKANEAEPHAGQGQQYPKAVDHVDHPSGVGKEPVVVKNAAEEKAYKEAKGKEEKSA